MKKLIILVLVLFVMASVALGQNSGSAAYITATITKMEKTMSDALLNGDLKSFESHMADEFLGVYGWGISERSEELESLKNIEMRSYEMSEVKVIQPSENVAIIAYKVTSEGSYMAEDFSGTYYAATTWINEGGTWKAAMHTEAPEEQMQDDSDMDMDMDSDTL